MTGNGTNPPKGGTAKETPMRFPTSRTATDKRVDLLWKPPHTPRARALLDRAERDAQAAGRTHLPRDPAAKSPPPEGPSQGAAASDASPTTGNGSDGNPATD
jgi:hypothetical protein